MVLEASSMNRLETGPPYRKQLKRLEFRNRRVQEDERIHGQ
jgi:hypothetical protein